MGDLCAEYVKEAVAEDNAGNYQRAFELYKIALEYFGTHLKYEKNARARETITAKVCQDLRLLRAPGWPQDGCHGTERISAVTIIFKASGCPVAPFIPGSDC